MYVYTHSIVSALIADMERKEVEKQFDSLDLKDKDLKGFFHENTDLVQFMRRFDRENELYQDWVIFYTY